MVLQDLVESDYDKESIDNFLYEFPGQNTKGLAGIFASKAELKRKALSSSELPPDRRGKLFNHQDIRKMILNMVDRGIILDEPGTGKTCSVTGFTEYISNLQNKSNFKRVFIITASGIVNEIKQQIVCKCSIPGKYDTETINNMENEEAQRGQITKKLNEWYTICTYDSFIKIVLKNIGLRKKGDSEKKDLFRNRKIDDNIIDQMAEYLSDTIIWIDELHNIRVKPGKRDETKDKNYRYRIFHEIFHRMQRSKLIGTTATIAINFPREIGPLVNLFIDKQIPEDFDWDTATVKSLEKYVGNLFLFTRSIESDVDIVDMGKYTISKCEEETIPLRLYISKMSKFQSDAYKIAKSQHNATGEEERNASLFVFPDGKWGTGSTKSEKETARIIRKINKQRKAERLGKKVKNAKKIKNEIILEEESESFKKYIKHIKDDEYKPSDEFKEEIQTLEDVKKFSAIFYDVIRIEQTEPGCGYYFINFIGGGAIPLAMCLDILGWERFYERESIFESKIEGGSKPYCKEQKDDNKQLKKRFNKPKLRYAMLTGATPENRTKMMFEAWNSYENRNGDIIKLFIITPTGKEGLSLNHVLRIHHDPMWSWSEIRQSIARALRITSHNYLKQEKENITISLYRHIAVDKEGDSIGCYMYHRALNKNLKNIEATHKFKILALDCNLTRGRNILDTDKPNTEKCDYQEDCNYPCLYKTPDWTDYSIADNLYIDEVYEELIPRIRDIYLEKVSYSFEEIRKLIDVEYIDREILLTLTYMINNYIVIKDKFGYNNFIKENGDIYYLARGFENIDTTSQSIYYDKVVLGVEHNYDLDNIINLMKENIQINLSDIDIEEINNYNIEEQVAIFEKAVEKDNKKIKEYFNHLYEEKEDMIIHWVKIREITGGGQKGNQGRIDKINNFDYIFRLYKDGKWSDMKLFKKAKNVKTKSKVKEGYFILENDEWEEIDDDDVLDFFKEVTDNIKRYLDLDIYGMMLSNNSLIVVDKNNNIKGRDFNTLELSSSYNILFELDAELPEKSMKKTYKENFNDIEDYIESKATKKMKEFLNKNYDENRMRYFYALMTDKKYKNRTGSFPKYFIKVLDEQNLILYL